MGNSLLYGEVFNIDNLLYYLWNITRTMANFVLVGFLLYQIIQIAMGGKQRELVNSIIKAILGVVLINMSWFGI